MGKAFPMEWMFVVDSVVVKITDDIIDVASTSTLLIIVMAFVVIVVVVVGFLVFDIVAISLSCPLCHFTSRYLGVTKLVSPWIDLGITMQANEASDMIPPLMLLLDVDVTFGACNGAFARVA
jgi:hypothetical protein